MEPMFKGPYRSTKHKEQPKGYGNIGAQYDNPYIQWLAGLRKNKKEATQTKLDKLQ